VEPFSGVLVLTAREDGPAGRAGVRVDDLITRIDGRPVTSREQFKYLIDSARPGDTRELRIQREGQEVALEVELGSETVTETSQPLATRLPVLDDRARAGMRLAEVTADVAPYVLGPESAPGGLLVLENEPGGPGFHADVRILDGIVAIDGAPVQSASDYSSALESAAAGDSVTLTVLRDGRKIEKRLRLVEDATAKWGFNALGLVKYRRSPGRWRFSLLWGILFNASGHACIQKRPDYPQNSQEGCWGVLLDLIAWHSTPRKKELRLLWLFPIGVRSD
jgi:C-terminal processing protease CtpA/Prc